MAKKEVSQPKVVDEVWTDERVRSFLDLKPYDTAINVDHYVLLRAYRAMVIRDFRTFVGYFVEAGRDLNATDPQGNTLLSIFAEHKKATQYQQALQAAGAQ